MRFLLDMCVPVQVVGWLRSHGHDAVHLRDEGLQRLPNGEIFKKGIAESRIVVTFDLDFAEIAALAGGRVIGVVLFRLHNTRADHVIRRFESVMENAAGPLKRGAVVVVEEMRIRVRDMPLRGK